MRDSLYLAWRYLAAHPVKTAILILAITLIVYIPAGLIVMVGQGERRLRARAEATPLLIGAKGSPLELALNSLYFAEDVPETMRYGRAAEVSATGLARAIPLYVRFRAGEDEDPIVGTTLDYLDFRGLEIAEGRRMVRLGDCVLGASAARRRGVGPGGSVLSNPESVFDLAGSYPLKMRVTGVLAPADSPDDDAIFVDVKTAWVIEGRAHGHTDLTDPAEKDGVLTREEGNVVGNASVVQYNEITEGNIDSFHFHGDTGDFPITAVLAVPVDPKSGTILLGRIRAEDERHQILKPRLVVDDLLATVFTVQSLVVAALVLVGAVTLAVMALVFALSIRLRQREIATMAKIGGSRSRIGQVLVLEVGAVLGAGVAVAALLTWATAGFVSEALRAFVS